MGLDRGEILQKWEEMTGQEKHLGNKEEMTKIMVKDAGAMVLSDVVVTINGQTCTIPTMPEATAAVLIINARTPTQAFSASDVGPTSIVITLKRTGFRDVVIKDSEKYQLALPPDPEFLANSVRVEGRVAGEVWASRTASTKVEMEVRYFMPPLGSVVSVFFGS